MFTTLVTWMGSDKSLFRAVSLRSKLTCSLRREPNCLLLEHNEEEISDAMQSRMARKGPRQALSGLTKPPRYYSVCLVSTGYRANRAGWWNTLHGSNPTLPKPVNGLQRIILCGRFPVLRRLGGPTDSPVGLGRFVFPVGERWPSL
jgi:hypothetical protein